MYTRLLWFPANPRRSFFLWGPKQTGKTTLLKSVYPKGHRIDLLKTDELMRYLQRPSLLREIAAALPKGKTIVIDEIQKAPALLDEIHYLIQEQGTVFALCGSPRCTTIFPTGACQVVLRSILSWGLVP